MTSLGNLTSFSEMLLSNNTIWEVLLSKATTRSSEIGLRPVCLVTSFITTLMMQFGFARLLSLWKEIALLRFMLEMTSPLIMMKGSERIRFMESISRSASPWVRQDVEVMQRTVRYVGK